MLYGFLEFFGILMWIDDDVVLVIVFLVDKWVCFCLNERGWRVFKLTYFCFLITD
jgi:hypothetical protein